MICDTSIIEIACFPALYYVVSYCPVSKQEKVTEALKVADQMEWTNRAEEIVLSELVYA